MGGVRMYELANRLTIRLYIYRYYINPEYNTQIYTNVMHVL